jgi:1,4-dihydroxy-2-naphthoate octaprenyltransferase
MWSWATAAQIRSLLVRLDRIGGLILLVAFLALFVLLRPSISEWLQLGALVAVPTLIWSLRNLRDDERGDRALVSSLLGVAVLGTVLFVTVSSLHSWSWVGGVVTALAIPLVVKGIRWFGRTPNVSRPFDPDDPTADVWQELRR